MKGAHLLIHGRVQGVCFRAEAQEKAEELGVAGWIRNTPDGAVECFAQASTPALEAFIEWCHRGPAKARVEKVDGVSFVFSTRGHLTEQAFLKKAHLKSTFFERGGASKK